jgi:hypothetical protein
MAAAVSATSTSAAMSTTSTSAAMSTATSAAMSQRSCDWKTGHQSGAHKTHERKPDGRNGHDNPHFCRTASEQAYHSLKL